MKKQTKDLNDLMHSFLESLSIRNYNRETIIKHKGKLTFFLLYLKSCGLRSTAEITIEVIDNYLLFLAEYKDDQGNKFTALSKRQKLASVKLFCSWLYKHNHSISNPTSEMVLPKQPQTLPAAVLTVKETEKILNIPDINRTCGIRDRAILETFYSTGIRRAELSNLELFDIDFEQGTVFIRQGKNRKDRITPIGERALLWLKNYLSKSRPYLLKSSREEHLFVTIRGSKFSTSGLTHMVGTYVRDSGIKKVGSCHLFRHTMATLMLENGASLRYIQEILGHASLNTTNIYTKVNIQSLKENYRKFMPSLSTVANHE